MSPLSVPDLAFVQITNPRASRYGIDRDLEGRDTLFGTVSRNIDEEVRAFRDGLAPGQVRRGLGLLPRVLDAMDGFCRLVGTELYLIEPLFYHSAVLYERQGCGYLLGREVMEASTSGFADSGGGFGPRRLLPSARRRPAHRPGQSSCTTACRRGRGRRGCIARPGAMPG
jgi:hypothetical protein